MSYRKVSHKARRGRRWKNRGRTKHGGHRNVGAVNDPISKAFKRTRVLHKKAQADAAAPKIEDFD